MADKVVIITGASGGIGTALVQGFVEEGWRVVGTSRTKGDDFPDDAFFVPADLKVLSEDDKALSDFYKQVTKACDGAPIKALINNAALQIVKPTADITAQDMQSSFAVNVLAPFRLSQAFLSELTGSQGSILNIGTVHAQATKPNFVAYATSKTAMHGLTRALAIDLGGKVRVNTLAPAAIKTPMLEEGFAGESEKFEELESFHPAQRIGEPKEVADFAQFLCSEKAGFITGGTFHIDGGILSRLHDPV
ncbi:SDR family NAD(P)-dependent oxidoreductase [Litorimonas sp.]|uniref:SDR family NAD(P)-dependent oxidoreductase n=1 Tax=Litorimonas sp. TaxID=1892381 RepID=UPI003A867ED8